MIIKKLHIRNIASIVEADIDFEKDLVDEFTGNPTNLFLITGNTGSGKSAILDAICMTLYKTTPRLAGASGKKDNKYKDPSNAKLVNVAEISQYSRIGINNTDPCYAELEFMGNDGKIYTARLSLGMSKVTAKAATLGAQYSYKAPKWEWTDGSQSFVKEDDIVPIREKAVGLSFEQFCRMALLAQGQFSEFLCGKKEQREKILELLTDTKKFSLFGEAIKMIFNQREKVREGQSKTIEGMEKLMGDSAAQRAACQRAIDDAQIEIKESAQKGFDDANDRKTALNNLNTAEEELKKLSCQETTLKQRFNALTADLLLHKQQIEQKEFELKTKKKDLEAQEDRKTLYERSAGVCAQLDSYAYYAQEIDNTKKSKEAAEKKKGLLNAAASSATHMESFFKRVISERQHFIDSVTAKRDALNPDKLPGEIKAINDDISDLKAVKNAHEAWTDAKGKLVEAEKAEKNNNDAIHDLQPSVNLLLSEYNNAKDDYQAKYERRVNLSKDFSTVRKQLQEGDECPVCHQTVDLSKLDKSFENVLTPLREEEQEALNKKNEAENSFTAKKAKLDGFKGLVDTLHLATMAASVEVAKKSDERNEAIEKTSLKLTDSLHDDVVAAIKGKKAELEKKENAQAECASLQNKIEKLQDQKNGLNKKWKKASEEKAAADKAVTDNQSIINNADNTILGYQRQQDETLFPLLNPLLKDAYPNWQDDVENSKADLKTKAGAYNALAAAITEKTTEIGKMKDANGRMDASKNTVAASKWPQASAAAVELIEDAESQWSNLSNDYSTYVANKKNFENVRGDALRTLKDYIEDDIVQTQKVDEDYQEKFKHLNNLKSVISSNQEKISEIEQNEQKLKTENDELDKLKAEESHWKIINDYFGGYRFRTIVQTFILRPLLDNANKYLKDITDQYRLTCDEQNEQLSVLVEDLYNKCIRSATVLSGGERFMISLALSLALNDLRKEKINVDILFIDEGFGTLDAESLNKVLCALHSLREIAGQKNRRVGLISHRPELSEIPSKIYLRKKSNGQSEVICPYEGDI